MATQPAPPAAQPTAWQMSPPATAPATTTGDNPMAVHLKVISILEIVMGVFWALAAVVLLFAFSIGTAATKAGGAPSFVPHLIATLGLFFVAIIGAVAVLALVGGIKLLNRKRSGKTLTFIVAVLSLISFPIGTAFGVYTIIILTRQDTDRLLVG